MSAGEERRRPSVPAKLNAQATIVSVDALTVVFRPVRDGKALEETTERLLSALRLGIIGEGRRLPSERELASSLGVSRMTLREAIKALQAAGYVASRRGRHGGTFVVERVSTEPCPLTRAGRDDKGGLFDVLVLREILESGAAAMAAGNELGPEGRSRLVESLGACEHAPLDAYRVADARLHLAVAEATGSASVVASLADALMRLGTCLERLSPLPTNRVRSDRQHRLVVEAILEGDVSAARNEMAAHVGETTTLLRAVLG